jgi:transposase
MRLIGEEEKADLEHQLKKTRDLSEWKRLFAILSYENGQSVDEIAYHLRIAPSTVETYLREYHHHDKTKNDPRGGSQSKLTLEESEKLEKHLTEITYLKVREIIAFVSQEFGKAFSRSGMNAWLKDRGFIYKKPEKIPGKIDPEAQEEFVKAYEELKKDLGPNEELYFMDAIHPEYQSQAVCGWIKKGDKKTIQTTGKQSRLHFSGALSLSKMEPFIKEYKTIDADAIIDFFKELENNPSEKIYVVLDNARAHRNKKLEAYLENSKISLVYLPPYSPNLNPIERLWKIMRQTVCYNRYYSSCSDFFESVRSFFRDKVPKMREELRTRINDNFQKIKPNPISLG